MMKTFFAYVEDGKTKVIDITVEQNYQEFEALCKESGLPVLGCVLDTRDIHAQQYADVVLRKD